MPENPACPTCRTPFRGTVAAGTRIVCASCMEEFYPGQTKPSATAAPPAAALVAFAVSAEPVEPLQAELIEDEPAPPPAPVAPAPKPRPKKRRRDDDYEDDERRPRRGAAPGLSPVQIALAVAGLLLLIGTFSVGIWLATRTTEDARRPDIAFAPEVPRVAPNDALNVAPNGVPPKAARPRDVIDPPFNPPAIEPPAFEPPPRLDPPRFEPPKPKPPEPEPETPLAPFKEPVIPIAAGKQTKLRELGTVKLPDVPPNPKAQPWDRKPTGAVTALAFAPKHKLLFALAGTGITVYDTATGKELGKQTPTHAFVDLSLAPDESALFASDYGGTNIGYGTPAKPSRFHRYDLKARKWEDRTAPKIAGRVEAVDSLRVLSLEMDQWVAVSLNAWETDGVGVRELARIGSDYYGDIEYDPRTGHILHGNSGSSSHQITVNRVTGDKLKKVADTGTYGTADKGGGTAVLSRCGTRFYYGALQVDAASVRENLKTFPEVIRAASRDIAFGSKAYYRATTTSKLGEFDFKTTTGDDRAGWGGSPAVITVAPDGLSVWVVDRDKNVARQFALDEGN